MTLVRAGRYLRARERRYTRRRAQDGSIGHTSRWSAWTVTRATLLCPRTLDSVKVRLHLCNPGELDIERVAQVDDGVAERVEDFLSVVQDANDVIVFCAGDIFAGQ